MFPLYTSEELHKAKSREKLPLKCKNCLCTFHKTKHYILQASSGKWHFKAEFCSPKCSRRFQDPPITVECKQCQKKFIKIRTEIKKHPNHFCSRSCNVSWQNAHKTKGTRRSKLEIWLESKLSILYPNLKIEYNQTNAINGELDIYIPSLKLAIELNGIFHYEPIYGKEKLHAMKTNDKRKFQACLERGIELCIINTGKTSFSEKTADKYLDIIKNLVAPQGIEP